MNALTELGIGIRREASADALIGRLERIATILAQIVATRRDADVNAIPVANDRVHAEPAVARLPLARVFVIADAGHQVPRIATVMAPEQRRRLHATAEVLPAAAGLKSPDVGERAPVLLGERRRRFRLLEALPHIRRTQHFHAEERIGAGTVTAKGTQALAAKYKGFQAGDSRSANRSNSAGDEIFVRKGVSIMPFFRKTEAREAELADLAAYLTRNAENPIQQSRVFLTMLRIVPILA